MASTYSAIKIELIGTGEQSGVWGTTTNTNLGTALEQAIVGKADVTVSSTSVTLTLTNTNALQDARALFLNLTGTPGGAATLNVPAIEKNYIVKNGTNEVVTIKVAAQTGVAIPVGKTVLVYNNGTDVATAVDHIPSLTLGAALPVASGGTGATTLTANNVVLGNGTSAVNFVAPGTSGNVLTSNGSTWTSASSGAAGSNTQVQFNNSGVFGASSNFTFNGTGITTGNVNVNSTTAPATGMYQLSTSSSGLSFQNASAAATNSTAMQIYFGRSTLAATTNGVGNNNEQFFGFGTNNAPKLTIPSNVAIYDFAGHNFLITDVPYVMRLNSGGRGDNTGYTAPESNGVLFINMAASYGGNDAAGVNGMFVEVPRQGLGSSNINGIKVYNRNFAGPSRSFWAQLKPDDPNGGGAPVGFYAQIDTSNGGAADNSGPIGLVVDNATTDNYAKINAGAALAVFYDRRSGSTSRNAVQFYRNTTANVVGTITTTNTATAYNTSSDYRLKENITPMTGALAKVSQLKPCTYTWKIDGSVGEGFIAHELQTVVPQAVSGEKDEVQEIKDDEGNVIDTKPKYQSVDTSFLVATLTAAIQELSAKNDALEARLAALEAQ